jgi:hypothetical protein
MLSNMSACAMLPSARPLPSSLPAALRGTHYASAGALTLKPAKGKGHGKAE